VSKSVYTLEVTEDERIKGVEDIYILSPHHEEILKKMDNCRLRSKKAREAQCMLIEGLQGAGKTTLREYYESQHKRKETEDGMFIPVLATQIGVPATEKSLATSLLEALGDPAADKGTVVSQTMRLRHLLKDCKTELIILDEFQHFIDRDSLKVLKKISDWLKTLINDTKIPIVLIGMPYSHIVLDARGNEQLKRRFSVRESLKPFEWGSTQEERVNLRKFLRAVDEALPLNERSQLGSTQIAFRFYCATNGIVSYIMDIIKGACYLAFDTGAQLLNLDTLADAYDSRFALEFPERVNPFRQEVSDLKPMHFKDSTPDFRALRDFKDNKETAASAFGRR
jgi:predicted AAA+ superfamily ATPase